MNRKVMSVARVVITFYGFTLLASLAHARIVACKPDPANYSVFLSEPTFKNAANGTDSRGQDFQQALFFVLDQRRDEQWLKSPTTPVSFVICEDRAPKVDGQEFDASLVNTLYTSDVLLEIWGQLDAENDVHHGMDLYATMDYFLVPIRYASNRHELTQNEPTPRALQHLQYSDTEKPAPDDFVQLIDPRDINAFVESALGVKLLREHKYQLAHTNLCRASAVIGNMLQRNMAAGTKQNLETLQTFLLASAKRAINKAKENEPPGGSNTGMLQLQESSRPCPGGQ